MFYDLLWAAFLILWLAGIAVGWLLASYYFRQKNSGIADLDPENREPLPPRTDGTGVSGRVGVVQAISQDRATTQKQVTRLEQALTQSEALLDKAHEELTAARTAQAQSNVLLDQRDAEIEAIKGKLLAEQAKNALMAEQVAHSENAAGKTDAPAKVQDQAGAAGSQKTMQLESELQAAIQARDQVIKQLSIHTDRLKLATAELERIKKS